MNQKRAPALGGPNFAKHGACFQSFRVGFRAVLGQPTAKSFQPSHQNGLSLTGAAGWGYEPRLLPRHKSALLFAHGLPYAESQNLLMTGE